MNSSYTLLTFGLLLLIATPFYGQSFQAQNIPNLTTTPSASRSANFIDVNNDGWDDIFITNGPAAGADNMLYINNQDGTFTTVTSDDIVGDGDRSDGASFADADNDGDLDAFVVTFGANGQGKKNYFYRNDGSGNFTYEPNIAMGIPLTYSEMATWIDVNDDQNLDLYFTNSVGSLQNLYFENQGDGSFEQVTDLVITSESLPSRSIDWIDYDGDGDCDLFVTNESNQKNSLFKKTASGSFVQITDSEITLDNRSSAGSSWGDIDNDGDFDLFVANYANAGQKNQLYVNNGGVFTEVAGSAISTVQANSFGSSFADVDNDGDLDLFVCNAYFNNVDTNSLFINDGDGNFTLDTTSDLGTHQGWTFGAAFGDYNNDGWMDIVLANNLNDNQSNSLYRNTGTGNNWIKLNCVGTDSNTSAVGATVSITATINGSQVTQTRKIAAASGYCSQNTYTVHFGLGDATSIDEVLVHWPIGTTESFTNVNINETTTIEEGQGTLGLIDEVKLDTIVYPNPVNSQLNLQFEPAIANKIAHVQIIDIRGVKVEEKEITGVSTSVQLDLSKLSAGIYIYELLDTSNIKLGSGKIVKK